MGEALQPGERPPVLKRQNGWLKLLGATLVVVFVVFIFVKLKQHENGTESPAVKFMLSGLPGTKFSLTATAAGGLTYNVTTEFYKNEQATFLTIKHPVVSCRLERLEGKGKLNLTIVEGTNLLTVAELPEDKHSIELTKDGWSHKEF